jgi:dipeptidyl aminopeptidase/acylaminoacyl peptidase
VQLQPLARIGALLLVWLTPLAQAARPLAPADWYRFAAVSDLHIAPDGSAVAYLVTRNDQPSDSASSQLWLAPWSGAPGRQVTHGASVSEPRFSPDGRYLSFIMAGAAGREQLWSLERRSGQLRQLTHVEQELVSYDWSPDGRRIVLEVRAGDDRTGRKPWVLTALHFKDNGIGYLTAQNHTHLLLLEVASGKVRALPADPARSDLLPLFLPDGKQIVYVSRRFDTMQQLGVDDIELVPVAPGAQPRMLLSTWSPNYQHLAVSPDGRRVAFLKGDELKYNAYILDQLGVVEVDSGHVQMLTEQLDRAVQTPVFTPDSRAVEVTVEDDAYQYPGQIALADGAVQRLAGPMVVEELAAAGGHTAVLVSNDRSPSEVYALEEGRLRALSAHNVRLLGELALGTVDDVRFKSDDGTEIHGLLVKPPDFAPGRRYPLIVWIHGGPVGQDDHSLEFQGDSDQLERQLFASHGYLVLAVNYRGSSGRGRAFARSIFADWGHKEVEDLLAGVDHVIGAGMADPKRLGVGGWSYGGLLTDYCIASTTRFRAAISGAGSGNQLATYGTDDSIEQYNAELGPPWSASARWLQVSYPFFHADRIHTPTLFMGDELDARVPVAGAEQMYAALRTLNVPTQLVVYPDEWHLIARPSFLADRFQRYLDWMDEYLSGTR